MSDFDKEAERQRLREKYEKDTERRQETQRMSELLLQGATMTNKHCNECGTPLFRYQGTEFCPTCQDRQAKAAAAEANAAAEAAGDAEANGSTAQSASADRQAATSADGQDAAGDATGEPATQATPAEESSPQSASQSGTGAPDSANTDAQSSAAAAQSAATPASAPAETTAPAATGQSGASEGTARASLLDAITHHARRATATDEPRRAKQHLEAAREAAEALDALDR